MVAGKMRTKGKYTHNSAFSLFLLTFANYYFFQVNQSKISGQHGACKANWRASTLQGGKMEEAAEKTEDGPTEETGGQEDRQSEQGRARQGGRRAYR